MDRRLRDQVWLRAASCCEYCRIPQEFSEATHEVDHIIAGRDPASGELTKLFHPRNDVWEKHFQWAGALLTGTSAIGRATVRVLEINVRHRVIHRQALIEEGVFPARHLSSQQDHGYDYGAMMSSVRTASSRTLHSLMSMDSPEPCSRVPLPP